MALSTENWTFSDLNLHEEVALEVALFGYFDGHAIADAARDVYLLFHSFLLDAAAVATGAKMLDFCSFSPAGATGGLHDEHSLADGLHA